MSRLSNSDPDAMNMTNKRVVTFGWADSTHIQRWIAGLSQRGFGMKLISLGGEPVDGVDATIYPYSGSSYYVFRAPQAALAARAFKPNILHVHYAYGFGLWGLLSRIHPMIVSVWGSEITEAGTSKLTRAVVGRVLHQANWVTATSHYLAEETCRIFPDVQKKLSIIPFGVDIPESCPPFPKHRESLRLCFIKGHRPVYGPDILIRAIEKVVQNNSYVELSIAGEGEITNELKEMVNTRGLASHVKFVGYIPNYRIFPFIQEHDVMIMPSIQESFGVAAVEASACGRPVIASRVGGVPEIILNGHTGLLVAPGSVDELAAAILKFANEPSLLESMGKAAYEYVKHNFTLEKSLDQMSSLYDRLIDEYAKKNSPL
jgi:L-malate glycosyltransferase